MQFSISRVVRFALNPKCGVESNAKMRASPFHGIFGSLREPAERSSVELPSFDQPALGSSAAGSQQATAGRLAVDIYEQDNYYIIKAALAGVRMSDLDIEVDDRTITIRGIRRNPDTIADDRYYLQECYWGEFSRSVTLPFSVDPKKIRATFNKDCILKVLIPREERVKVVKISEV